MDDKPHELTKEAANSQEIWKYLSIFTLAVVALSLTVVIVFIALFISLKGSCNDIDIVTKFTELEGLKTKVGIIEDRLKDGQLQQTCHENEKTCTYKSFKSFMVEMKEEIDNEMKKKLGDLETRIAHSNIQDQTASSGDESTREYLTKKLDELESRVRAETEARLSDLEKRLKDVQAQVNDKKYVSIH